MTLEYTSLRADLALALRAAAHHGLSEGVCNHFSVAVPGSLGQGDRFLLNPQPARLALERGAGRRHRAGGR